MATLEIPDLGVNLPVYHGTSEAVLQVALGHVEGSSLPVGGEGTHCVISGHRGLPSAKLFSNLDQLVIGDVFLLRVLDETLTYQVDQILVVEPEDMEALALVPGEDYCTLVTCTPYGINSHRLLVRGTRIETEQAAAVVHVTSDAAMLSPLIVAAVIAAPLLLLWLIGMMLTPRKR
ncbi:MAG: class C sortase, partial [Aristaeellaceae bacterium]